VNDNLHNILYPKENFAYLDISISYGVCGIQLIENIKRSLMKSIETLLQAPALDGRNSET
jgi:hypothetical protein